MIGKYILVLLVIWSSNVFASCKEILKQEKVMNLTVKLAYRDFPKVADILAIMDVESSCNPKAINHSEREASNGIMQVNGGPMNLEENMIAGVDILREYYLITRSKIGAVKAYNIGIGNYRKNRMPVSADLYYSKFKNKRKLYENYPKKTIRPSANSSKRTLDGSVGI